MHKTPTMTRTQYKLNQVDPVVPADSWAFILEENKKTGENKKIEENNNNNKARENKKMKDKRDRDIPSGFLSSL